MRAPIRVRATEYGYSPSVRANGSSPPATTTAQGSRQPSSDVPGLGQHPDGQTDQSPRDNDNGERQDRPRSNRCLGRTTFVRCSEETELLIEREPACARPRVGVLG